ncbi:hypothetical protein [Parvicella tangerina]|uniref:Uncharacterized protein n=1 Tax=Parvicella tangerina TaxID=2829795 RepID=A0A916JM14_9FLAO|nr:hypothetical protein [Parvicella tangerina]CAG5079903.1 hypothetical protein CRYO30217_01114 [Parvicella tangerina]
MKYLIPYKLFENDSSNLYLTYQELQMSKEWEHIPKHEKEILKSTYEDETKREYDENRESPKI